MALNGDPVVQDDLSALSWVHDELRRSLDTAHKALRRYLKEAGEGGDLDRVDPAVLRQARSQLHQSVGVLELVGLGPAIELLRASEAALQRLSAKTRLITPAAVDTLERGSFALLDYIGRRLAGKAVSPLALFPQYKALQELAGATRIHPADLWPVPFSWRMLPAEPGLQPRHPDAVAIGEVEADLLALMRGAQPSVAARMSEVFAALGAGTLQVAPHDRAHQQLATLWQLAAGFFEAQADGLLGSDIYTKRVGSQLLKQLRAGEDAEAAERLAHDLLYFCGQAAPRAGVPMAGGGPGVRLAAVREVYRLPDVPPVDIAVARLGRFDPAWVAQARKRVGAAKEVWSAVAGGDLARLPGLAEQFTLVADSLQRLYPDGGVLGQALQAAVQHTVASGAEPPAELAMEVATALLYVDASLDDADFDHPELVQRIHRLAQRIEHVRQQRDPGTLELWMEELYRRVSDRQTMGSVVSELRASLSEVEKNIDQYFRDPTHREVLIPVPGQLGAMRGVLSVLGLDQASQAVLRMRDDVAALAETEVDPLRAIEAGTFDRLADNLGALSFLIDMVAVQPQMAKSLFRFDAHTGSLSAVMAREDRPSGFGELDARGEAAGHGASRDTDALAVTLDFDRMVKQARVQQRAAHPELGRQGLPLMHLDEPPTRTHGAPMAGADDDRTIRFDRGTDIPTVRLERPTEVDDERTVQLPRRYLDDEAKTIQLDRRPEPADDLPTAPLPQFPSVWDDDDRTVQMPRHTAFADDQATTIQLPRRDEPPPSRAHDPALEAPTQPAPMPTAMPTVPAPMPPAAPLVDSGLEDDPEMREIFLEEAAEVLQSAREGLQALQVRHDDHAAMTTVRRAFHTLKGSSRMVGLRRFGEAAWACEQLYNTRLAEHHGADTDLREFTGEALHYIADWVAALTAGDASAFDPDVVAHPADALRLEHRRLPLGAAAAAPAAASTALPPLPSGLPLPAFDLGQMAAGGLGAPAVPADVPDALPEVHSFAAAPAAALLERVPDLPSAADLDFTLAPALPADAPDTVHDAGLGLPEATELALPDLDLAALDDTGSTLAADLPVATPDALPRVEATEAGPADAPAAELPVAEATETPAAAVEAVQAAEAIELPDLVLDLDADLAPTQPLPIGSTVLAPDVLVEPPAPMDATLPLPAPDAVLDLVLDLSEAAAPAEPATALAPPAAEPVPEAEADEAFKQIGPLRIGIALFNIYLNEADELSRRLGVALAEWSHELHRPVGESAVALAHSLAGSSGTVGYADLSQLARALEHALERAQDRGHGHADEAALFTRAADEIRRLLHLFAAGFLNPPDADLLQQLLDAAHAAPEVAITESAPLDEPLPPAPPADTEPVTEFADAMGMDVPAEPATPADAPAASAVPAPSEPAEAPASPVAPAGELGRAALLPFTALPATPAPVAAPLRDAGPGLDDEIDAVDTLDEELFPVFVEEALEMLPQLQGRLRDWTQRPGDATAASACMRSLHTLKGSARLAGAMHLGEMAHRLESAVARQAARGAAASVADIEPLIAYTDTLEAHFDRLRGVSRADEAVDAEARPTAPPPASTAPAPAMRVVPPAPAAGRVDAPTPAAAPAVPTDSADTATTVTAGQTPPQVRPAVPRRMAAPVPARRIDWRRFQAAADDAPSTALQADRAGAAQAAQHGSVRVRVPLLDRLVNQAGEVSFSRTRIETDLRQFKGALVDLSENLERLRSQLRDIELQAESQIGSRLEAARAAAQQFDPLEMDRFTRFQELTRMMVESVSDVATVQRGLQRTLQSTEDALAHQARMTRDMQDDLLRTRMVEFEGLSERLYRVVRQAAKETGKPVRLDIVGGSIEIDRGVLDRMTPAFEHLLRNSVVHGIEPAAERAAAGKDATGTVTVTVSQLGNEVAVEVRDDGGGLHLDKIRQRALALGLLAPEATPDDGELANLVFQPGFTTATELTDLAGRGVGMDVVRTDVNAMGGRIETASAPGQGASFKLVLPLTTAVTQVVMLRCGERTVAVPSTLVETVKRIPAEELAGAYERGVATHGGRELPFFWLDSLLQGSPRGPLGGRSGQSVVVRSADQRIVLHVDDVLGNQEVVIKHLGPQLARLPGMVGMTLLPSGLPAPIYNPVALATLYGEAARAQAAESHREAQRAAADARPAPVVAAAPLVLVVDDSLTVRRVTQRLLEREGYRVTVAKDGLDALEKLAGELPSVILSDIEMPRMDGFDLVRNLRSDERLTRLPVVMITSRIAQKHRDYAAELGVNHYLGKPYAEDELLALVAGYARAGLTAAA